MGIELHREEPALYEHYFSAADRAAGLPISESSLEGDEQTLMRTEVAQPAVFALSLALVEYALGLGLRAHAIAGHSLGEYTAAVVSGALDLEAGMLIVAERGRLMAQAQSERPGRMIAIIGLEVELVASICAQASTAGVAVVGNVNAPSQIVVSGEAAALERVQDLALLAGAEEVIRLAAGGAFHSPLMSSVRARLTPLLERCEWRDPRIPVVANTTGGMLSTGRLVRAALGEQIDAPLLWTTCVATLRALGCTSFLEIGPRPRPHRTAAPDRPGPGGLRRRIS